METKFISFEELTDAHLERLHEWLQSPHVKDFWDDGDRTLDQVKNHYKKTPKVKRYLFFIDNLAVGYIQSYLIDYQNEYYSFILNGKENLGIDFFIGNMAFLNKKLAIPILSEFIKICCSTADRIIVDPESHNHKAIHLYQKYGFTKIGELKKLNKIHFVELLMQK